MNNKKKVYGLGSVANEILMLQNGAQKPEKIEIIKLDIYSDEYLIIVTY